MKQDDLTRLGQAMKGTAIELATARTWEENAFDWQHECELLRQQMVRIENVLEMGDAVEPCVKLDLIDALTAVPCSHRVETPKP